MNPPESDWRLQGQESYLKKSKFVYRQYQRPRLDWDHDHCEFCGIKILEERKLKDSKNVICEAYVNEDDRWICPECFLDFKDQFEWNLKQ